MLLNVNYSLLPNVVKTIIRHNGAKSHKQEMSVQTKEFQIHEQPNLLLSINNTLLANTAIKVYHDILEQNHSNGKKHVKLADAI